MNATFWQTFFTLLIGGLFGSLCVIPYALALNPEPANVLKAQLEKKGSKLPGMIVVVLSSFVNSGVLVAISAFVGLNAARATGLQLPVLQAIFTGQPVADSFFGLLPLAILWGLAGGAAISILEVYVFAQRLPAELRAMAKRTTFWKSVLACFYGGIVEEILIRLFIMGGFAWLLGLVWRTPAGLPTLGAFWTANLLSTILFGLGHLPALVRVMKPTPFLIVRTLVLNGIAGIIFGYLYMTYGLEYAMIAHFSADIVIHLVLPALLPRNLREPKPISAAA